MKPKTLAACPKCGKPKLPHAACEICGYVSAKVLLSSDEKVE